jgi:hypothetical protein
LNRPKIPPGTNVSAKLVNTCLGGTNMGAGCTTASECPGGTCGAAVSYTLACTTTSCAVELPGVLTFVPVGPDGCVAKAAAVVGCSEDPLDSNRVLVFVDADGVALSAGAATVPIATIRARATAAIPFSPSNPCGGFGTRADTPFDAIVTTDAACSANLFIPAATGGDRPRHRRSALLRAPGSAGSSDECNDAKKSDCMVIEKSTAKSPQHETDCAVGTILADESCS